MERLAGAMWASGESRWPAPKIEGWLLREMASEPEWQLAYSTRLPDLWKEDLRTATFIVRGKMTASVLRIPPSASTSSRGT
jgi:hypothetical protein